MVVEGSYLVVCTPHIVRDGGGAMPCLSAVVRVNGIRVLALETWISTSILNRTRAEQALAGIL